MSEPIKFNEFVDLGDGIRNMIQDFNKLDKESQKSLQNVAKAMQVLVGAQSELQGEMRQNAKLAEQLTKATDQESKALNDNIKSTNRLTKSLSDNANAQKEAVIVSEQLGKSVNDQKLRVKQLQAEYDSLDPTLAGNQERMKQLSKSLVRTRADIKKLTDASKRANATFDSSSNSYNGLIEQNKRISQILRKLPPEFLKTNKRAQQLQKTFRENTERLKEFDKAMGQNFRNVGNYGDALGKLNGLASGGVKLLGALGLAGAFAVGAKEIFDHTKELEKNSKTLQKLLRVGGKDLDNFTARATAIAQVFEQDFNMVAKATNVLMEQLGSSGTEALDTIEQALIRGADVNEDFLEQIAEYSVFFNEAELSAQNMIDVMISGEDKGIFSDKALDAVKEASIRIRELPQSTRDALEGLGISANQIQRDLASGTKSVADVIAEVSTEMGKLPEQSSEVGTAIADIFGGAGEDAGLKFLLTLKDLNKETGDYTENLTESQKATKDLLDSQTNLNSELTGLGTSFETTGNQIKAAFNNILAGTVDLLSDLIDGFNSTETVIENFAKSIQGSRHIGVLTQELEKLENTVDDPSVWDRFKAGVSQTIFGIGAAAKSSAETVVKMDLIRKRIAEIREEDAQKELEKTQNINKKKTDDSLELMRRERQAARDLAQFQLEQQIRLLSETKNNEEATLNERLSANELIVEKQVKLAEIARESALDTGKKLLKDQRALIETQFDDAVMIAEKAGDEFSDALFEGLAITPEKLNIDQILTDKLNLIETAKQQELKMIAESDAEIEEKERQRAETSMNFLQESLMAELNFLQKRINMADIEKSERIRIAKEIATIETELAELSFQQKEDALQAFLDSMNQAIQFASALNDINNSLLNAQNNRLENELTNLDIRSEAQQAAFDREIELAGNNEEAKERIEQRRITSERRIEAERRKLKRKQAENDKKAALFGAIINTAQGVTAALGSSPPPANFILAALVAVAGGIEIASISSEPLPAFAEGTDSAPGGIAIVGEKGRELVYDPKTGKAGFTPSKPSLMDVPEGAQVFDAVTTRRMLKDPELIDDKIGIKNASETLRIGNASLQKSKAQYMQARQASSSQSIDYERLGKEVGKNLPAQQMIVFEENGIAKHFTKLPNGSMIEHKNKQSHIISPKHPIVKEMKEIQKQLNKK